MLWWICVIYCFSALNSWDSKLNSFLSECLWLNSQFSHMCHALHLISYVELILIQKKKDILYSWIFDVTCNNIDGIKSLLLLQSRMSYKSKFTCVLDFKSKNQRQSTSVRCFALYTHDIRSFLTHFSFSLRVNCQSTGLCWRNKRVKCRKKFEINIYVLFIDTLMLEWKEKQFYGAGKGSHV